MDQYVGLDVSLKEASVSVRQNRNRIWRRVSSLARYEVFKLLLWCRLLLRLAAAFGTWLAFDAGRPCSCGRLADTRSARFFLNGRTGLNIGPGRRSGRAPRLTPSACAKAIPPRHNNKATNPQTWWNKRIFMRTSCKKRCSYLTSFRYVGSLAKA